MSRTGNPPPATPGGSAEGAARDALQILVLDTRDKMRELESRILDPDAGLVVIVNAHNSRIQGLEHLPETLRAELREAIDEIDGKRKASWASWEKIVVALITALAGFATASLAMCGGG